jgi:hypothetical protein
MCVCERERERGNTIESRLSEALSAYSSYSIRQHTSAHASIRQHTSAYVSIHWSGLSAYGC